MKTAKRILTVALALMLIFALAAPSFAIVPANQPTYPNGASYYVQTSDSDYYVDGEITVHLHVLTYKNGGNYIDRSYDVTVGDENETDQLITVKDVLDQADLDNSDIAFHYTSPFIGKQGIYEYVLDGVQNTSTNAWYNGAILYKGSTAYACNYMFRINGMLPFYSYYDEVEEEWVSVGCLICDAYVTEGDNIDVYYANAYQQSWATGVEYVRRIPNSNTFQIIYSKCYYINPSPDVTSDWIPTPWMLPYADEYADIYIDGVLTTVYVDEDGQFTLNNLSAGTHSFMTDSSLFTKYATTPNGNTKYDVPLCASLYSKFVIN